jgi:hypothetical protein
VSERLAAQLTGLAQAISAAVPSAVSVSLSVVRDGVELSVAASAGVDQQLAPGMIDPGAALALALSQVRSIQQGLGALIELGYEPIAARAELAHRAELAGTTMAVASRVLLADVPPVPQGDR